MSVTLRSHLTPGKDPVPIVQEAGWASGPVWTGAENLAPPAFDPRKVQPVGSRYTDYATRPFCSKVMSVKYAMSAGLKVMKIDIRQINLKFVDFQLWLV